MKIRRFSVLVTVLLLLPLILCVFMSSAADEKPVYGQKSVISQPFDALAPAGLSIGDVPSAHGNNQTRIAVAPSGVYLGVLTGDKWSEPGLGAGYTMSLVKVNPDGTAEQLFSDSIFGTSTTATIMVDKAGDIWLYSAWANANGGIDFTVWHYNVSTGETEKFTASKKPKGNSWGYSVAVMDAELGKIYGVITGGVGTAAFFGWCPFDIETKEWGPANSVRCDARYCYHFGYADGKGGFFVVNDRDAENYDVESNISGMRVSEAMEQLRSRKGAGNYVWDEGHLIYIPDAYGKEWENLIIDPAVYDVEKGVYPNWVNNNCDVILDKENGYLYVLGVQDDNGTPGIEDWLFIYDVNDHFRLVEKKVVSFLMGPNATYFHRFYLDAEGKLYLVLTADSRHWIEIWMADGEVPYSDFRLVCEQDFEEGLGKSNARVMISATERNNSIRSDTGSFILSTGGSWYYFTIDFAALRGSGR